VVDAIITRGRVYVAFRNSSVLALNTTNITNLTELGVFTGVQASVDAGQFLTIKNGLETLFITDQKLYFVRSDSLVVLDGYRSSTNF